MSDRDPSRPSLDAHDIAHLARTVDLAERGRRGARPNPVVGAVLARGDEVLAEGFHARHGDRHAERVALDAVGGIAPQGSTLYVSLEPCAHHGRQPPCAEAIVASGVRRVVIASPDPSAKTSGVGPALLARAGIEVGWGPAELRRRAIEQNAGFHSVHVRARPHVTAKLALTRDLRVATGDPARRWITGEASRALVHEMRAASGAVLVGSGTVLADDPWLTVRGEARTGMAHDPVRVVLDRSLRTPSTSHLARSAGEAPALVVTSSSADAGTERDLAALGVEVVQIDAHGTGFLAGALHMLAVRGVGDVLVEAGPTLTRALHAAGLVDVLVGFHAPFTATDAAQPGFAPDEALIDALLRASEDDVDGVDTRRRARLVDLGSWCAYLDGTLAARASEPPSVDVSHP